ncbi:hypothetical protein ACT413_11645 [Acinetobacter baumannii]
MAVPDKDALIGPTVTEAQFKTNLGAIVDFIKPIETQSPTYATTALLTATKPTDNQAYAKALDTGKVWFWNKPAGSPEGNYWTETRLSDLDKAETQIKEYVGRSISSVMPVVVDGKGEFTTLAAWWFVRFSIIRCRYSRACKNADGISFISIFKIHTDCC